MNHFKLIIARHTHKFVQQLCLLMSAMTFCHMKLHWMANEGAHISMWQPKLRFTFQQLIPLCNNKHLENRTIWPNLSSLGKFKLVIIYPSSVELCPYFEAIIEPWTPFQSDLLICTFSILSFEYLSSAPTIIRKGVPFAILLNSIHFLGCKEDSSILQVLRCSSSSAFP